jgi:hypothetical protein
MISRTELCNLLIAVERGAKTAQHAYERIESDRRRNERGWFCLTVVLCFMIAIVVVTCHQSV